MPGEPFSDRNPVELSVLYRESGPVVALYAASWQTGTYTVGHAKFLSRIGYYLSA